MRTVSFIDHVLINSKEKVSNYGLISNVILDHDFIYCTRKTKTVKTGKHNTLSIKSLTERFRKRRDRPDYFTFICIDDDYIDLTVIILT